MVSFAEAVGKKVKKFKVADVEIKFRPRVEDVAVMMSVAAKQEKGEADAEDVSALLNSIVEMIYRANKDDDVKREDVEAFVVENIAEVMEGIVRAMGLDKKAGFRKGK